MAKKQKSNAHRPEDTANPPNIDLLLGRPVVVPSWIDAAGLTQRETQITTIIAYGHSNEMVARSLVISVETVREHVANILKKSGLLNRTALAAWFLTGCRKIPKPEQAKDASP